MKELSKEQMKKIMGGLVGPPIGGGDTGACNKFCSANAVCYGDCIHCNKATGVVGPNGETSLCSKILE